MTTLSFRRIRRIYSPVWICCALLLGVAVSDAKAGFIGYYSPQSFSLLNVGGGSDENFNSTANGTAEFPDLNTLILTGTNDGSGNPGNTDLTIVSAGSGLFQFQYMFNTADQWYYEYAGYYTGSLGFQLFANTDGMSGSFSVPVVAGELIGFRAGGDNQGGVPGVLTITNFSAPVPEPGTLLLCLIAVAGFYAYRRLRGSSSSPW